MINTYQSSVAPPPVPPRLHSSHQGAHPVLIPAPMLPQGTSRTLLRFMVAVVLLNLLMSILGFLYLYKNGKQGQQGQEGMPTSSLVAGPAASMQKQDSYHVTKRASHRAFARMVFLQPTTFIPQYGPLKWDIKRSRYSHPHINYYNRSWLTIEEPGEYLVYSRITFSKAHATVPLTTQVKHRKSERETETEIIMQAFCFTALCTATAEDVIKLEKGNQLSVWTEDISLVRYDTGTTFGLYNLWQ